MTHKLVIGLSTLAVVAVVVVSPAASAAQSAGHPGVSGASAQGRAVDVRGLPDQPEGETPGQPRQVPRRYPVDTATFGQLKAQANQAAAAQDRSQAPGVLPAFGPAPDFPTVGYTGWNPPDAGLAVGPSHVLVAVNESYAVYNRSGTKLLGPKSLGSLFLTTDSTFDPRALYDIARARFVVLSTAASYLTLAVSRTSDPMGSWCAYRLTADPSGATWADFPGLGSDGDYLYVTANLFANADNSFRYAQLQAIPKSSAYDATCPAATPITFPPLLNPAPVGGNAFTVQPASQPDARSGDARPMYFVNAMWSSGSNIAVRAVTRTPTGLTLSDPAWVASGYIAPYDLPADTPQPRGRAIDTGDTRLPGAVFRYGRIYTANTTRHVSGIPGATPNPYANAQWYEITPNNLTDSMGASHAVTNANVAFFFPSILPGCAASPCTSPSVVLEVSGAGRTQAAAAFWSRGSGGSPTNYTPSAVGGYTLGSRWGDYAATAADPSPTGPVWVLGEYAQSGGAWGTAVASVTP
jgi:hypothetical protein